MFIFQLKLKSYYGERDESFSFPQKPPSKKFGTMHINYYGNNNSFVGWFKSKNLEEAEKGFISNLRKQMTRTNDELIQEYNSTTQKKNYNSDLIFLSNVMDKTILKYGDLYPELFI